jgi:hypothetical protein
MSNCPDDLTEAAKDGEPISRFIQGVPDWDSPGYVRLASGNESAYVQLLRLLLIYIKVNQFNDTDKADYDRELQKWRAYNWRHGTDWYEYTYAGEEYFNRVTTLAGQMDLTLPTLMERITKFISRCRKDVIDRFSERCRREKVRLGTLTWEALKETLFETVMELEIKLPWENSETIPLGDICDNCQRRGHTKEKCWLLTAKPSNTTRVDPPRLDKPQAPIQREPVTSRPMSAPQGGIITTNNSPRPKPFTPPIRPDGYQTRSRTRQASEAQKSGNVLTSARHTEVIEPCLFLVV